MKSYWAECVWFYLDSVEAILIRMGKLSNMNLRNQQNVNDIVMTYGVTAIVRNVGKAPNFIKAPGVGAIVNGFTQPWIYYNGNQVKP